MKKHKPNPFGDDFELVPDTVGVILDSIWIKKDGSELKIRFATGQILTHKQLES